MNIRDFFMAQAPITKTPPQSLNGALEQLENDKLNLGSPEKAPQVKSSEVPTVKKKLIRLRLSTAKSADVPDETSAFNFSQVSAELETIVAASALPVAADAVVPVVADAAVPIVADSDAADVPIVADSADAVVPVVADSTDSTAVSIVADSTDSAAVPIVAVSADAAPISAFSFELPDYSRWLVAIVLSVLIDWTTFPFKDYFVKVADIELDEELQKKSTKTKPKGGKARQTFIRFSPTIPPKEFSEEAEWIYIFLVDGKIVKIGGTRTGLSKRCGSYLSGHGIPELKGTSTSTNAYIYWTFLHLLLQGKKVEMYACRLPDAVVTQTAFGITRVIRTQCFHDWEAYCMEKFAELYGSFPPLSDNCDPRHRKKGKGKKASKK